MSATMKSESIFANERDPGNAMGQGLREADVSHSSTAERLRQTWQ